MLYKRELTKTGNNTAIKEWVPSGFLEPYSQPVLTAFQIKNVKYERKNIVVFLYFIFENFEISCSNKSKGTNATKIKNATP